jgi:AcrR family transcriptional regulator
MTAPVAATARGRRTREQLLTAAADLVAERGFHAVGIADIGAAAGVSGAAIYRHFASKQDILIALLDRVVEGLRDGARVAVTDARSPEVALDALIAAHVDFALRDRSIIAVYDQEAHTLPDDDRRRIRHTQRAYAEIWVDVLRTRTPDLTPEVARAAVHAAFGLVNSVSDYRTELPDDELRALLVTMAAAALEPTHRAGRVPT